MLEGGLIGDDIGDEIPVTGLPASPIYAEFRATAQKIENYNIYKNITEQGYGQEVLGTRNAHVEYNMHLYLENSENPFDTTFYQRKPNVIASTNSSDVLPGILYALQTMRGGEQAEFLIGYELMYREMGCEPRIPPRSDIYAIIELVRFNETGDENAIRDMDDSERRTFKVVKVKANELYQKALDSFHNGYYKFASREFDIAIKALEFCHLSDQTEENEQQEFLVKLYRNQATTYNKLKFWKKTCLMSQELQRISKRYTNYRFDEDAKAIFQWGRALFHLGEYHRARAELQRAQALKPNDSTIKKELKDLLAKEVEQKKHDLEFSRRAMKILSIGEEEQPTSDTVAGNNSEVDEDAREKSDGEDDQVFALFQETMRSTLIRFIESDNELITLPPGLSDMEYAQVQEMAEDFGLCFRHRTTDGNLEYYLTKQ